MWGLTYLSPRLRFVSLTKAASDFGKGVAYLHQMRLRESSPNALPWCGRLRWKRAHWLYGIGTVCARSRNIPVTCLHAREAKAALSLQSQKTDRNDAHGLAQIVRT